MAEIGNDQEISTILDTLQNFNIKPKKPGRGFPDVGLLPRWPRKPDGIQQTLTDFHFSMDDLALDLFRLVAVHLGLGEHYFDPLFNCNMSVTGMNYYPPQTKENL